MQERLTTVEVERDTYHELYQDALERCRKLELGLRGQKSERLPNEAQLSFEMLSMMLAEDGKADLIEVASVNGDSGIAFGYIEGYAEDISFTFGSGVKMREVVIFTRQFATMIAAGLPLVQSLSILAEQTENPRFATVITAVLNDIQAAGLSPEQLRQVVQRGATHVLREEFHRREI